MAVIINMNGVRSLRRKIKIILSLKIINADEINVTIKVNRHVENMKKIDIQTGLLSNYYYNSFELKESQKVFVIFSNFSK